jgi:very-short-patch-repair endonuclease
MGWTSGESDDWRKDYSRAHARAKKLRAEETPSGKELWKIPRRFKHEGAHFRRQCQLGRFVDDFA